MSWDSVTELETEDATTPRSRRTRSWAKRLVLGVALLIILVGFDWFRPAEDQTTTRMVLAAIELYQRTASPHMDSIGVTCRFEPSCSHYGHAVIERYGLPRGAFKATSRIVRCGPWTEAGTVDPP